MSNSRHRSFSLAPSQSQPHQQQHEQHKMSKSYCSPTLKTGLTGAGAHLLFRRRSLIIQTSSHNDNNMPSSSALPTHSRKRRPISPALWQSQGDSCMICNGMFTFLNRRHHCRYCGILCCASCSSATITFGRLDLRACDHCAAFNTGDSEHIENISASSSPLSYCCNKVSSVSPASSTFVSPNRQQQQHEPYLSNRRYSLCEQSMAWRNEGFGKASFANEDQNEVTNQNQQALKSKKLRNALSSNHTEVTPCKQSRIRRRQNDETTNETINSLSISQHEFTKSKTNTSSQSMDLSSQVLPMSSLDNEHLPSQCICYSPSTKQFSDSPAFHKQHISSAVNKSVSKEGHNLKDTTTNLCHLSSTMRQSESEKQLFCHDPIKASSGSSSLFDCYYHDAQDSPMAIPTLDSLTITKNNKNNDPKQSTDITDRLSSPLQRLQAEQQHSASATTARHLSSSSIGTSSDSPKLLSAFREYNNEVISTKDHPIGTSKFDMYVGNGLGEIKENKTLSSSPHLNIGIKVSDSDTQLYYSRRKQEEYYLNFKNNNQLQHPRLKNNTKCHESFSKSVDLYNFESEKQKNDNCDHNLRLSSSVPTRMKSCQKLPVRSLSLSYLPSTKKSWDFFTDDEDEHSSITQLVKTNRMNPTTQLSLHLKPNSNDDYSPLSHCSQPSTPPSLQQQNSSFCSRDDPTTFSFNIYSPRLTSSSRQSLQKSRCLSLEEGSYYKRYNIMKPIIQDHDEKMDFMLPSSSSSSLSSLSSSSTRRTISSTKVDEKAIAVAVAAAGAGYNNKFNTLTTTAAGITTPIISTTTTSSTTNTKPKGANEDLSVSSSSSQTKKPPYNNNNNSSLNNSTLYTARCEFDEYHQHLTCHQNTKVTTPTAAQTTPSENNMLTSCAINNNNNETNNNLTNSIVIIDDEAEYSDMNYNVEHSQHNNDKRCATIFNNKNDHALDHDNNPITKTLPSNINNTTSTTTTTTTTATSTTTNNNNNNNNNVLAKTTRNSMSQLISSYIFPKLRLKRIIFERTQDNSVLSTRSSIWKSMPFSSSAFVDIASSSTGLFRHISTREEEKAMRDLTEHVVTSQVKLHTIAAALVLSLIVSFSLHSLPLFCPYIYNPSKGYYFSWMTLGINLIFCVGYLILCYMILNSVDITFRHIRWLRFMRCYSLFVALEWGASFFAQRIPPRFFFYSTSDALETSNVIQHPALSSNPSSTSFTLMMYKNLTSSALSLSFIGACCRYSLPFIIPIVFYQLSKPPCSTRIKYFYRLIFYIKMIGCIIGVGLFSYIEHSLNGVIKLILLLYNIPLDSHHHFHNTSACDKNNNNDNKETSSSSLPNSIIPLWVSNIIIVFKQFIYQTLHPLSAKLICYTLRSSHVAFSATCFLDFLSSRPSQSSVWTTATAAILSPSSSKHKFRQESLSGNVLPPKHMLFSHRVPLLDSDTINDIILTELKVPMNILFRSFNLIPITYSSSSTTHRAVLHPELAHYPNHPNVLVTLNSRVHREWLSSEAWSWSTDTITWFFRVLERRVSPRFRSLYNAHLYWRSLREGQKPDLAADHQLLSCIELGKNCSPDNICLKTLASQLRVRQVYEEWVTSHVIILDDVNHVHITDSPLLDLMAINRTSLLTQLVQIWSHSIFFRGLSPPLLENMSLLIGYPKTTKRRTRRTGVAIRKGSADESTPSRTCRVFRPACRRVATPVSISYSGGNNATACEIVKKSGSWSEVEARTDRRRFSSSTTLSRRTSGAGLGGTYRATFILPHNRSWNIVDLPTRKSLAMLLVSMSQLDSLACEKMLKHMGIPILNIDQNALPDQKRYDACFSVFRELVNGITDKSSCDFLEKYRYWDFKSTSATEQEKTKNNNDDGSTSNEALDQKLRAAGVLFLFSQILTALKRVSTILKVDVNFVDIMSEVAQLFLLMLPPSPPRTFLSGTFNPYIIKKLFIQRHLQNKIDSHSKSHVGANSRICLQTSSSGLIETQHAGLHHVSPKQQQSTQLTHWTSPYKRTPKKDQKEYLLQHTSSVTPSSPSNITSGINDYGNRFNQVLNTDIQQDYNVNHTATMLPNTAPKTSSTSSQPKTSPLLENPLSVASDVYSNITENEELISRLEGLVSKYLSTQSPLVGFQLCILRCIPGTNQSEIVLSLAGGMAGDLTSKSLVTEKTLFAVMDLNVLVLNSLLLSIIASGKRKLATLARFDRITSSIVASRGKQSARLSMAVDKLGGSPSNRGCPTQNQRPYDRMIPQDGPHKHKQRCGYFNKHDNIFQPLATNTEHQNRQDNLHTLTGLSSFTCDLESRAKGQSTQHADPTQAKETEEHLQVPKGEHRNDDAQKQRIRANSSEMSLTAYRELQAEQHSFHCLASETHAVSTNSRYVSRPSLLLEQNLAQNHQPYRSSHRTLSSSLSSLTECCNTHVGLQCSLCKNLVSHGTSHTLQDRYTQINDPTLSSFERNLPGWALLKGHLLDYDTYIADIFPAILGNYTCNQQQIHTTTTNSINKSESSSSIGETDIDSLTTLGLKRRSKLTLRHLLTATDGLQYAFPRSRHIDYLRKLETDTKEFRKVITDMTPVWTPPDWVWANGNTTTIQRRSSSFLNNSNRRCHNGRNGNFAGGLPSSPSTFENDENTNTFSGENASIQKKNCYSNNAADAKRRPYLLHKQSLSAQNNNAFHSNNYISPLHSTSQNVATALFRKLFNSFTAKNKTSNCRSPQAALNENSYNIQQENRFENQSHFNNLTATHEEKPESQSSLNGKHNNYLSATVSFARTASFLSYGADWVAACGAYCARTSFFGRSAIIRHIISALFPDESFASVFNRYMLQPLQLDVLDLSFGCDLVTDDNSSDSNSINHIKTAATTAEQQTRHTTVASVINGVIKDLESISKAPAWTLQHGYNKQFSEAVSLMEVWYHREASSLLDCDYRDSSKENKEDAMVQSSTEDESEEEDEEDDDEEQGKGEEEDDEFDEEDEEQQQQQQQIYYENSSEEMHCDNYDKASEKQRKQLRKGLNNTKRHFFSSVLKKATSVGISHFADKISSSSERQKKTLLKQSASTPKAVRLCSSNSFRQPAGRNPVDDSVDSSFNEMICGDLSVDKKILQSRLKNDIKNHSTDFGETKKHNVAELASSSIDKHCLAETLFPPDLPLNLAIVNSSEFRKDPLAGLGFYGSAYAIAKLLAGLLYVPSADFRTKQHQPQLTPLKSSPPSAPTTMSASASPYASYPLRRLSIIEDHCNRQQQTQSRSPKASSTRELNICSPLPNTPRQRFMTKPEDSLLSREQFSDSGDGISLSFSSPANRKIICKSCKDIGRYDRSVLGLTANDVLHVTALHAQEVTLGRSRQWGMGIQLFSDMRLSEPVLPNGASTSPGMDNQRSQLSSLHESPTMKHAGTPSSTHHERSTKTDSFRIARAARKELLRKSPTVPLNVCPSSPSCSRRSSFPAHLNLSTATTKVSEHQLVADLCGIEGSCGCLAMFSLKDGISLAFLTNSVAMESRDTSLDFVVSVCKELGIELDSGRENAMDEFQKHTSCTS